LSRVVDNEYFEMKKIELDDLLEAQTDTDAVPFPSIEEQRTLPDRVSVGLLTIDFVIVHTNSESLEPRYGFRPAHNLALDFYEALYLLLQGKLVIEATKVKDKNFHEISEELERTEDGTNKRERNIYDTFGIQKYDPKDASEAYYVVSAVQLYEHACKDCSRFSLIYPIYHRLAMKNWYIRPGLNYGTEFILYSAPPGTIHSTYAVAVHQEGEELVTARVFGMVRVCVGAVKRLILAVAEKRLEAKYGGEQELREDVMCVNVKMVECGRWDPKVERMKHDVGKQLEELSIGKGSDEDSGAQGE
jgi:tRNA-intron lyase